jgi:hypothetical protein
MILGSISANSMIEIKKLQKKIWILYREKLNKEEFCLGKQ